MQMRTGDALWEQSLHRLRKLGQISALAHERATSAREAVASAGDGREARNRCHAMYSALQARSQTCDVAYLKAADMLVRRAASQRRPPMRLPQPWPVGVAAPAWWVEAIRHSGAVWRSIPKAGPELTLGLPMNHPAVTAVGFWAEMLGASRQAKDVRGSSVLYGSAEPGRATDDRRASAGLRIRPGMVNETRRLHTDRYKVWERARAYGDAAQVLLAEWHHTNT